MDTSELDQLNTILDRDSELREKIKDQVNEFDKRARTMVGLLNRIHVTPTSAMPDLLDSLNPVLDDCKELVGSIAAVIPPNQFWRWKDLWSNSLRTAVFAVVLAEFLKTRNLATLSAVSDRLGIKEEWKDRVSLAIEDYLHGIISVVNELSRLAVNSVTLGNFEEPLKISAFVKDIFIGFSMLNLKNDPLRRRFDSLKYDIKKVEEVVYDVSLRKLASLPTMAT
ncbi:translin [Coprinopsis marcescibilis]|uniref:Translin n=1 Tax=Coprinopsis marcescibilis TaxID=230819 RepID=A0A5C3L5A4_COPMA|nr:translin [Coprinopsis marcescibilis]